VTEYETTTKTVTETVTVKGRRELELLDTIIGRNNAGAEPSKADLTRGRTSQARAADYQRIDKLIRLGLVEDSGTAKGGAYALVATADGRTLIERGTVDVTRTVETLMRVRWAAVTRTVDGARWVYSYDTEAEAQASADRSAERDGGIASTVVERHLERV